MLQLAARRLLNQKQATGHLLVPACCNWGQAAWMATSAPHETEGPSSSQQPAASSPGAAPGSSSTSSIQHAGSWQASKKPVGPAVPLFTQALQSKTEQELLRILQQSKFQQGTGPIVAAEQGEEEEVEEDPAEFVNPQTGEKYGPKGKEPTRHGDWEFKGRCTDFE